MSRGEKKAHILEQALYYILVKISLESKLIFLALMKRFLEIKNIKKREENL